MFCTECGTKLEGAFCTNCGAASNSAPVTATASKEQVVVAQILVYVEQNWSEDFEEFIAEIPEALAIAHAISAQPETVVSPVQLSLMEETFSEFISGGGYSRDERFDSLEEFIEEMDEG